MCHSESVEYFQHFPRVPHGIGWGSSVLQSLPRISPKLGSAIVFDTPVSTGFCRGVHPRGSRTALSILAISFMVFFKTVGLPGNDSWGLNSLKIGEPSFRVIVKLVSDMSSDQGFWYAQKHATSFMKQEIG